MKNKKHINESRKDWGGYYSDNSTGYRFWAPSTPEDAMSVAKGSGEKPSDIYRGILRAKEINRNQELKDYGLPSDANLTNRRKIKVDRSYEEPMNFDWDSKDYDWVNYYRDTNGCFPYNIPDHAGYSDEVPSNHSQRQQELTKTFNANDKKLRRMQKKAGVLNENTIRKIVEETLKRVLKESFDCKENNNKFDATKPNYWKTHHDYNDEMANKASNWMSKHYDLEEDYDEDIYDGDEDYNDEDDWRSEEPSENDVQDVMLQVQNKCNDNGAIFKDLGDNEFGVLSRDNNAYAVVMLLKKMESNGVIYNTGGKLSEIGPWHAKFRVINSLNENKVKNIVSEVIKKTLRKTK